MPKIERLFAFVAEDNGPDDEGIMGFLMPDRTWMPLVGADFARMSALQPIAEEISKRSGKPYRILEFSLRRDITEDYYHEKPA
jgi:hypothetical protein